MTTTQTPSTPPSTPPPLTRAQAYRELEAARTQIVAVIETLALDAAGRVTLYLTGASNVPATLPTQNGLRCQQVLEKALDEYVGAAIRWHLLRVVEEVEGMVTNANDAKRQHAQNDAKRQSSETDR